MTGRLEVQGHPGPHNKFKPNFGNINPVSERKEEKEEEREEGMSEEGGIKGVTLRSS